MGYGQLDITELNLDYDRLLEKADLINKKKLRECVINILNDYKEDMFKTYGSRKHNHYPGGLVSHLLGVTENCLVMSERYSEKVYNKDILLVSAMLHDIGKVKTHKLKSSLVEPDERLINHAIWSGLIVKPYLDEYKIESHLSEQILHCIIYHMLPDEGVNEFGSMHMIEQYILHIADGLDAKLSSFVDVMDKKESNSWFSAYEINFKSEICKSVR